MGYIFDFKDAKSYEQWFKDPRNRFTSELETRLMLDMLRPYRGETLLDIGCGIGESLKPFLKAGLLVTGLDPSPYMLDITSKNLGNRVELYRGFAEDLPFEDNSFNYACLVTTLEFTENPEKSLEEACRVAKDKIFIGVLNKYAIKGLQRRLKGMFAKSIFNHARFFSVWDIKNNIRKIMGQIPITWRTVCQFPGNQGNFTRNLEQSSIIQRFPFGAFVGMAVTLVPRFRTRPLAIKYRAKQKTGIVPG